MNILKIMIVIKKIIKLNLPKLETINNKDNFTRYELRVKIPEELCKELIKELIKHIY